MKLKNTNLASLICVSLLGSAALSQADVLVSEDFDTYSGWGGLFGENGGTGFSGAWYSGGAGSNIYCPSGTPLGISPAKRDLTASIGDTGTIWLSFDWSCNDDTNGANTGASQEWGTFSFFNGGSEIFAIGNPWHNNTWQLGGVDSGISNVGARKTAVVEFTLGAGATDSAKLWVGATGSPVDVSGAAAATVSGFDLNGVGTIRIMGTAEQTFDNLLIGTTMADVDATTTPPPTPTSGTWTNTAGGTWGTAGNWLNNIVATGSDSTAYFNTLNLVGDTTVQLSSPQTIGNLVFADGGSTYGWTLTNNGNSANILTLAGTTPTITVNALGDTKTVAISAKVAGTAGLTKAGTGTLTLSAANTYTGSTTVSTGTLQLQGGAFSTTARSYTIASDSVLNLDGDTGVATGTTTFDGTGTLRITGGTFANETPNSPVGDGRDISMELDSGAVIDVQSGAVMYNGGWQNITWTNNLADLNADGSFDLAEGQNVFVGALSGAGSIGGANFVGGGGGTQKLTVGVGGIADDSSTFSGNVSGGIGFTKTGSGTQTLSGTISYTGNTTVEDGGLSVANPNFADTSTITIGTAAASPAVLDLPNAGTDTVAVLIIDGVSQAGNGTVYDSTNSDGAITGSGKIQVGTADPFANWIETGWPTLSDKTPGGDPDNDGMKNLLEYVLKDGDPSASNTGILPTLDASGTDFVFTYLRRTAATGTTQTFQYGSDLGATPWTDVAVTNGGIVAITTPEAGIEQVVITVPKDSNTKLFGRLQVTQP